VIAPPDLDEADAALVRVCASVPEELPLAWNQWLGFLGQDAGSADPAYPAHWRDLLPLVALLQRRHGLAGPDWLLSRLRTAAVLEERRLGAVRGTTAEVLRTAAIAAASPLVIGGLGIGETVYPDPASRHTGILSLMLASGTRLPELAREIQASGYRVRSAGRRARFWPFLPWARVWLMHPSGFQLLLLSAPPWRNARRPGHADLLRNARQVSCPGGLSFATPRIEDALRLLATGIGGEQNPRSLLPPVDRAMLLRSLQQRPAAEPDDRSGANGDAAWQKARAI
jgi:hypothetical protein